MMGKAFEAGTIFPEGSAAGKGARSSGQVLSTALATGCKMGAVRGPFSGRKDASMLLGCRGSFCLASLLVGFASSAVAFADVVHLTNGRSFEGVVAEEGDQQVKIRMEEGTLTLPRSLVERVDKGDTSLAEFLRRKNELRLSGAGAGSWLDLARWAQSQGMSQAAREAALKAATLNPQLSGVEPILRSNGYVFDADLDRWVSYDDSMRRKGFVQFNGEWISRRELAQRQLAEQSLQIQAQAIGDSDDAGTLAQMPNGAQPYGVDNGSLLLGAGYSGFGYGRHGFRPFFSAHSMRSMRPHIPAAVPAPRAAVRGGGGRPIR
jgi:hypothetical protein